MDRIFSGAKAVASRFVGSSKAQRKANAANVDATMERKSRAHNRGGEEDSPIDEIIYRKGWLYTYSDDGDVVQRYCILRNFEIVVQEDENEDSELQTYSLEEWMVIFDVFQKEGLCFRVKHKETPERSFLLWTENHNKKKLIKWRDAIHRMRDSYILDKASDKEKNLREELKQALVGHNVDQSELNLALFLQEANLSVEQAKNAILKDKNFREECNLDGLNAVSVYDLLKTGLAFVPGSYDRDGRPVVYFHAARHFPGQRKFIDILKLVLYLLKKAISLCVSNYEIAIVEQLEGTTRANQDTRFVKLIVEVQKASFPGLVGNFYAVNCPWYYPMLISLVRPFLSKDLSKKIHAYSGPKDLESKIDRAMMPADLGGPISDDLDNWIDKLLKCENLTKADLDREDLRHQFGESVQAVYDDKPAANLKNSARKYGFLKKKGNWVQLYNSRFVVLTDKILYYYKEEEDLVADGAIILRDANVRVSDSSITISTPDGRTGIFSASSHDEAVAWSTELTKAIGELHKPPLVTQKSSNTLHMV